jgi:hypothetical protein
MVTTLSSRAGDGAAKLCREGTAELPTVRVHESASRLLVSFGVLNDNLIKGLTSFIKCISRS